MKILCCSYRDWAFEIYKGINSKNVILVKNREEFSKIEIFKINPDLILWYGWSWIIPLDIVKNFYNVMLHPSPLPKYRGGSPIQNQILNGEKESCVTLFKIDEGLDTGDIISQEPFSLEGDLNDIFERIIKKGIKLTNKMIENFSNLDLQKQNSELATVFKRRKPEQSEISLKDFQNFTAQELHDKIRCLQDPYPNAFVKCKNGTKLFLKKSDHETLDY